MIPAAGSSHAGFQGACFPVTQASRLDFRVIPRQHQLLVAPEVQDTLKKRVDKFL